MSGDGRPSHGSPPWAIVAENELRTLWLSGRGLPLMFGYCLLLSATTYLVATNQALNFLEQRESVSLTLQVAVAVGALVVLLATADAISGERERGTLESLLLTPAARPALVVGKGLAGLSLWLAALLLALPYLWYLGHGVGVVTVAVLGGAAVGTLLALFLAGSGLLVSVLARSNRVALAVVLFSLLALFVPTQMPTSAQQGWLGDLLLRVDPITAGLHYLGGLVIDARPPTRDLGWLIGPVAGAVVMPALALFAGRRIALLPGNQA